MQFKFMREFKKARIVAYSVSLFKQKFKQSCWIAEIKCKQVHFTAVLNQVHVQAQTAVQSHISGPSIT